MVSIQLVTDQKVRSVKNESLVDAAVKAVNTIKTTGIDSAALADRAKLADRLLDLYLLMASNSMVPQISLLLISITLKQQVNLRKQCLLTVSNLMAPKISIFLK